MKGAVVEGDGELVIGPRKVIETDVKVAGGGEPLVREREHGELVLRLRQLGALLEDALRGLHPGDVRVAEDRESLGGEREDVIQRAREGFRGLQGQAVNEVEIDRGDPRSAEPVHGLMVLRVRLEAVDRALDGRVGVLHTERSAMQPHLPQGGDVLLAEAPRVNFDADFGALGEDEALAQEAGQPSQLLRREKSRGAAAEVQLHDRAARTHAGRRQVEFAGEKVEVAVGRAVAAGNDGVAAAVPAERLAERKMDVEGDGTGLEGIVLGEPGVQIECREVGVELRGRGVGRVPGCGTRVAADQGEVERRDRCACGSRSRQRV